MLRSWNVAIGNFFFQYRNFLFPCIFVFMAFTVEPRIFLENSTWDRLFVGCGAAAAIAGQIVRFVTIGFQYIHRGGKDRQVYANRLVSGGVYGVVRNPMYIGNALIAVGMTIYMGAPQAIFIVVPFFLFIYQAIIFAEEEYLRNKFGAQYDGYCARVNRFVPSLRDVQQSFAGMHFDWRSSVKRDMGTIVGITMGLLLVPVWRTFFLEGWAAAKTVGVRSFGLACAGGLLYAVLIYLKKRKRFIFRSTTG